jgi:Family of unknown function (DUF6134)
VTRHHLFFVAAILFSSQGIAAPGSWAFRVFLDNREVGEHRFTLTKTGAEEHVRSSARFDVRILMMNVFRYRHEATERWLDGCLLNLQSETQTNGQKQQVSNDYSECPMSFAYWNPKILTARELVNSQTGVLTPVKVTQTGSEDILVRGKMQSAIRYRLTGPKLAIDLWYVDDNWVALESEMEGGRRLRYRLI